MTRAGLVLLTVAAVTATADTGCGSSDSDVDVDAPSGTVLVAAAASLTDVIEELATRFEARYPDVDVEVSVGGSSSLAFSIEEGAPIDVFASANEDVMERLVELGAIDDATTGPVVFATNTIVIAVPAGGDDVQSIADFERADLLLGACASQVPCGSYADELFARAGVDPSLDTRDGDVRALVTKLVEAELDGGIVYRSDVVAFADDLDEVVVPAELEVVARYPVAITAEAPNPTAAAEFARFLTGADAADVLQRSGFGTP